eukprot:5267962-Karenia_brevis.AAC.1
MRQMRGASGYTQARLDFRNRVQAARRKHITHRAQDLADSAPESRRELHKHVKSFLQPKPGLSQIYNIGPVTISGDLASQCWAHYLYRQSSYDGPLTKCELQ